jgi:hypothetical protein
VSCPAEDAVALAEAVLRLRSMLSNELQRMGEAELIYYTLLFVLQVLPERRMKHFSQVLLGTNH